MTQKTAWFILQKIRTLFAQDGTIALEGDVECDEAYIGGRAYSNIFIQLSLVEYVNILPGDALATDFLKIIIN